MGESEWKMTNCRNKIEQEVVKIYKVRCLKYLLINGLIVRTITFLNSEKLNDIKLISIFQMVTSGGARTGQKTFEMSGTVVS